MRVYSYTELSNCDLIIDAIYEGGNQGNTSDDPITKILPVGNQGGFRYAGTIENSILLQQSAFRAHNTSSIKENQRVTRFPS